MTYASMKVLKSIHQQPPFELSIKGKTIHVVIQGDANTRTFYALILNPSHTVKYVQTGKVERLETLVGNIERTAKKEGVKEIVWDPKLKKYMGIR